MNQPNTKTENKLLRKYQKEKFFDLEIYMEKGMGNPYRIDNFIPILILKYIPVKLGFNPINL